MLRNIDLWIVLPAVFLLTLGGIILSSVVPNNFPQQFLYIALAILSFLVFANIDIKFLRQISPFLYVISVTLLLITILFGALIRGSARWIEIGPIVFQPSEIIKPLFLLFLANLIAEKRKGLLLAILAFIPLFVLVFIQPDLGSAIVLASGFFGILFFANVSILWFLGGASLFAALTPIFWRLLADYQKQRMYTFLSPTDDPLGAGYNSIQAVIAIGAGGLFGRGLGQGTQSQLAFLPERHTDFVYAALSEELGFLASFSVVIAFALIFWRIIHTLRQDHSLFVQSLLGGIFFCLLAHVVVNIGMNLGVLPVTGIPLPFVSSGGSALVSMSAMLGLVSQVSSGLRSRSNFDIL